MTDTTPSTSTAVAAAPPQIPVALGGRLSGLDEAYRLAKALAMSALMPDDLKNKPNDVLVITLYGRELDLAPMQSVQVIDVVKGRPFIRAQLWVALARRAGHKVRTIESTAETCTVEVTRHDDPEPHRASYTMEDAKLAGLTSNTNYTKNPKSMLYARAATTACRQACPEVALGFGDEYERELAEERPVQTLAQVVAARPEAVDAELVAQPDATQALAAAEPEDRPSDEEIAAAIADIETEHTGGIPVEPGVEFPPEDDES